jgi:hypothetical protein
VVRRADSPRHCRSTGPAIREMAVAPCVVITYTYFLRESPLPDRFPLVVDSVQTLLVLLGIFIFIPILILIFVVVPVLVRVVILV